MLMYKEDVEHWHNNNTQLNYGEFFHDAGINKVHETGNFCDVESVMLINTLGIVW